MMHPTIHTNGTHPDILTADLENALEYLRMTIAVVEDTAPNARDYYPQGPDAYAQASLEHTNRLVKLASVRVELNAMLEQIVG